jgi:hypothetical protein
VKIQLQPNTYLNLHQYAFFNLLYKTCNTSIA